MSFNQKILLNLVGFRNATVIPNLDANLSHFDNIVDKLQRLGCHLLHDDERRSIPKTDLLSPCDARHSLPAQESQRA